MTAIKIWECAVCGYEWKGNKPPNECPQCSSNAKEFILPQKNKRLIYDGKKFEVLLINGSSHNSHNSGQAAEIAEQTLKKKKISYRRYDLNKLEIQHCWCCYSMRDEACTYPCRNQLDDMPALHEMLLRAKAAIIISPINWNGMSARLKDFLDRCTCIQNQCLLGKKPRTIGKVLGVIVQGHEDGAAKTMLDIYFYFQQMGYIMAPMAFAYRTHGAGNNAKTDNAFLKKDKKFKKDVSGAVNNVIQTMKLKIAEKLKNKTVCVSE